MAEAPTLLAGIDRDEDVLEELARLESVYPHWRAWLSVARDQVYARRLQSSPEILKRSADTAGLWEQVRNHEHERDLRR